MVSLDIVTKAVVIRELVRVGCSTVGPSFRECRQELEGGGGSGGGEVEGPARGKGGGKRWMKCRGNEEIKIGRAGQVSEKKDAPSLEGQLGV